MWSHLICSRFLAIFLCKLQSAGNWTEIPCIFSRATGCSQICTKISAHLKLQNRPFIFSLLLTLLKLSKTRLILYVKHFGGYFDIALASFFTKYDIMWCSTHHYMHCITLHMLQRHALHNFTSITCITCFALLSLHTITWFTDCYMAHRAGPDPPGHQVTQVHPCTFLQPQGTRRL
jgi:hypothetical protein